MELRSYNLPRQALRLLITALLAACGLAPAVHAQGMDSKGKDFWVAFMANFGSLGDPEISDLRLYLSSDRPTTVTITYTMTGEVRTVNLPVPNVSTEFIVSNEFGGFVELDNVNSLADEIQPKSLHIVSDNDITLYGVNIRAKSADAFLGLPVDVLTGRYIVLAYPNGFSGSFTGNGSYDMPSEFAVVATEDGTVLNIVPTSTLTINRRPPTPYTVSLKRGEIYFGQAYLDPFIEQDVTGTQIDANKPVAVFGGNRRTSIPTRVGNYRDHLCEQLPPLDGWGRGGLLTPHFKVTPASNDTAVARIVAAFPATDVTITRASGSESITIGPGISYEIPLLEPMTVKGSQPIMMAQYEHSVNIGTPQSYDIGDPFMMLVVPTEQFDTAYAFQSIRHSEFVEPHYINVVIPPQAVNSIRLDNQAVAGQFRPIPGSAYVYAQISLPSGAHYIRADSAFGLYVYGFGQATSYGYPGGMMFRKLVRDFEPPDLFTKFNCGTLQGYTADGRITDTGIDSCYATSDTQNVVVVIEPFTKGADTVHFTARLIDPYRDGVVAVRGIDGEGRSRGQAVAIPGFTVRFSGSTTAPALLDTFVALNAKDFCRDIMIKNYGKFEQNITGVLLSDTAMRKVDPAQFPFKIAPGDSAKVTICFENVSDTLFSTLLTLVGDCGQRDVAIVPVDSRIDTTAPNVGIEGSPCSDEFLLTYYEHARASGIASVDVDTTINCTAEKLVDPTKLPAQLVQVRLHRIDPRQDLTYKITLRDAVGNKLVDSATIGGFTVNLVGRDSTIIGTRYDRAWEAPDTIMVDGHSCYSLQITNYGSTPVLINRAMMRGNILYSLPPSQFPIVVPPFRSSTVLVCIDGYSDYDISDTLILLDACGHAEELGMMTPLKSLTGTATSSSCNTTISFATFAPAKRVFLTTPQPNPVHSVAAVDVGLPAATDVTLDVYSAAGEPVLHVMAAQPLKAGISRVSFTVDALDAGAYFCRMRTTDGSVHVVKMVVQR